ncbi:GSCOCG00005364001-RA-CDS, partial [Cotesia congregata]
HSPKPYYNVCQKLLLYQLINTWVLFLTDWVSTESGPVLNSSSSRFDNSSGVISDFGFANEVL